MKLLTYPSYDVAKIPMYYDKFGHVSTTQTPNAVTVTYTGSGKIEWKPVQVDIGIVNSSYQIGIKEDIVIDGYKFYGGIWTQLDFMNHIGTLNYDFAEEYPPVHIDATEVYGSRLVSYSTTPAKVDIPYTKPTLLQSIRKFFGI